MKVRFVISSEELLLPFAVKPLEQLYVEISTNFKDKSKEYVPPRYTLIYDGVIEIKDPIPSKFKKLLNRGFIED